MRSKPSETFAIGEGFPRDARMVSKEAYACRDLASKNVYFLHNKNALYKKRDVLIGEIT